MKAVIIPVLAVLLVLGISAARSAGATVPVRVQHVKTACTAKHNSLSTPHNAISQRKAGYCVKARAHRGKAAKRAHQQKGAVLHGVKSMKANPSTRKAAVYTSSPSPTSPSHH